MLLGLVGASPATQPVASAFRPNVRVEVTDEAVIVHSDGLPDHETGDYPNAKVPYRILPQDYSFVIPRTPRFVENVTPLPAGPIGVAVNGIPFYNPADRLGRDAGKYEVTDDCCGHPDQFGRYHYHIYPRCIHTSFADKAGEHSALIGYAFDGFAIYGPNGEGGKPPADLDACNGHSDPVRGYHYHVTHKFPYILGGYHGVPEAKNFDRPGAPVGSRGPG